MAHFEFYDLPQDAKDKLIDLRAEMSANRFLLAGYRLQELLGKANFNPNQARVPAGSGLTSGRWSGVGDGSSAVLRRVATTERVAGYPSNLLEEEQRGGHAIANHVSKTENYLLGQVRQGNIDAIARGNQVSGLRVGSFSSLEAANKLVNATLAQNEGEVQKVVAGKLLRTTVTSMFGSPTGYEAYSPTERSQPYIRNTYGVGVVIQRDTTARNGYRIVSAFPVR